MSARGSEHAGSWVLVSLLAKYAQIDHLKTGSSPLATDLLPSLADHFRSRYKRIEISVFVQVIVRAKFHFPIIWEDRGAKDDNSNVAEPGDSFHFGQYIEAAFPGQVQIEQHEVRSWRVVILVSLQQKGGCFYAVRNAE